MKCPECDAEIYRYSMEQHYQVKHGDTDLPDEFLVSAAEKKLVKNKNFTSKMAMQPSDMSKLSDDELRLFSASEFWNKKTKLWKTTKMGTWAKANSNRVKRVLGAEFFTA